MRPVLERLFAFCCFVFAGWVVLYGVDPYRAKEPDHDTLYFFYQPNCLACKGMRAYLDGIRDDYKERYAFEAYDVNEMGGKSRYAQYMNWHEQNPDRFAVPVVFVNGGMVMGYAGPETSGAAVNALLDKEPGS